jgi:negative regulator of sigma E activity
MKPKFFLMTVLMAVTVTAGALSVSAFAQTPITAPERPPLFLGKSLEREAGVKVTGVVAQTITFPPSKNQERALQELPAPPVIEGQLLRRNFRASIEVGEPIAGRDTWRLTLKPNNPIAPTFHFWIDQEWLVRLGYEELDSSGIVTDRARFTSLDGVPKVLKNPRRLNRFKYDPSLEATVLTALPGLSLPEGFRVMALRPRNVNGQQGLEVRASNGLSVMVLVISPVGNRAGPKLAVRNVSGTWLWVVANMPKAELDRAANSLASVDLVGLGNLIADRPR